MRMPRPAKKQKLLRAPRDPVQPRKKAMALVKEVMVIEEPACIKPSLILSGTDLRGSV